MKQSIRGKRTPEAFHKYLPLMLKDIFWTKSVKEIGNDSITMNQ